VTTISRAVDTDRPDASARRSQPAMAVACGYSHALVIGECGCDVFSCGHGAWARTSASARPRSSPLFYVSSAEGALRDNPVTFSSVCSVDSSPDCRIFSRRACSSCTCFVLPVSLSLHMALGSMWQSNHVVRGFLSGGWGADYGDRFWWVWGSRL